MKSQIFFLATSVFVFPITQNSFSQTFNFIVDSVSFSSLPLEGGKTGMEIADINNDGHPDVLSVGDHGSPNIGSPQQGITVWFGNGTATGWTLFQNGNFGYGGISAGDLNNDGKMDVAFGMHHNYSTSDFGDQLLEAALGDGTGMVWTPWDDSLGTAGETYGMFGTDMADFDHDGKLDIGSTSFGCCAGYHVYKNLGTGTWQHAYGYTGDNASDRFIFGDMNHDGKIDFAVTHQNGTPYFGDGTGNFIGHHLNLPVQPTFGFFDISLGDANNDGADDLCFTMFDGVFVYTYDTTSLQWVNLSGTLPVSGYFAAAELHDMNLDGFMDVVAIKDNLLRIYLGDGAGNWTTGATITVTNVSNAKDMVVEDVNHNGIPEIFIWGNVPVGSFGNTNKLFLVRDTTTVTALNIFPKTPTAGECISPGSIYFVKWSAAVPSNHPSSVSLEFSSTSMTGPWSLMAAGLPNNGVYQWTVPTSVLSADCFIRYILTDSITSQNDTAYSPGRFNIGCVEYVPPVIGIKPEPEKKYSVRISPNPFTDNTYFSVINSGDKKSTLQIFDALGRELFPPKEFFRQTFLERKNLSPGIYFYSVVTTGEEGRFGKLVVR